MQKIILTSPEELQKLIHDTVRELLDENAVKVNAPQDEIFNIDQACQFLNLAKQTVYSLTSQRKLPFFKRSKKLYFRRSELLQWILAGKKKSTAEIEHEMKNSS